MPPRGELRHRPHCPRGIAETAKSSAAQHQPCVSLLCSPLYPSPWDSACCMAGIQGNWPTQLRLDGGMTGGGIYFRPKHWDGVDEQETAERRYESGFPGLRIQPDHPEQAGTLLAQSFRNPGPQSERQVAPNILRVWTSRPVCQ